MNALIVDDDEEVLGLLDDLLHSAGYTVVRASNGTQALQALESRNIRLVVCDRVMPELDGLELCRLVRSSVFAEYVYIIILSGRHETEDIVSGLNAGADDYVGKPFHPEELLLRLAVAKRIAAVGSRHVTVFALAKLAESRDPETGQHLERIRSYCWTLAHRLADRLPGNRDEYIQNIYHTSPLHDIGKVGIPDHILLKPDRLSEREFEIMRTHTTIGAGVLEAAIAQHPDVSYLTMARDIILTHHEKYDGSGYPSGLRGSDIPLSGRIVALADVYDALTSRRAYKAAYEHEVARGILLDDRGRFDAQVLQAFLDAEEQFLAIRDALSDAPALT